MPTNTSITASLVGNTVPPDRDCVRNLQDVINGVVDFITVLVNGSAGDPTSPNNSIANQALNVANTALAGVQALQAGAKERRTSGLFSIPTGDSETPFVFGPAMPDTEYDIFLTLYAGASAHPAAYYGFRILESSIATNGFTLLFDNIPANTKAAIVIVQR